MASGPEVRYSVAAVYVEQRGFSPDVLDKLSKYKGGKRVDTGANLLLWRPFDQAVLAGRHWRTSALKVTSAIQTFLDLKKLTGAARRPRPRFMTGCWPVPCAMRPTLARGTA